jgi:hypothetical protein
LLIQFIGQPPSVKIIPIIDHCVSASLPNQHQRIQLTVGHFQTWIKSHELTSPSKYLKIFLATSIWLICKLVMNLFTHPIAKLMSRWNGWDIVSFLLMILYSYSLVSVVFHVTAQFCAFIHWHLINTIVCHPKTFQQVFNVSMLRNKNSFLLINKLCSLVQLYVT